MIIDCHCHAGVGSGLTDPWDTRAALDKYLDRAKRAGIDKTNLFPVFTSDYTSANRRLGEFVVRNPSRFYGFAMVHPMRDKGRIYRMVAQGVKHYGFCGIKVHRHDGRISREICETARRCSIPVLYDVMGAVAHMELVAAEYPDVTFIIPHLGSFGDDWRAHVALTDLLVRIPNIFADTSAVRRFDYLAKAVERAGAQKILFGSDGPWLHPGLELDKILALRLSREEEHKVLGKNFLEILRQSKKASIHGSLHPGNRLSSACRVSSITGKLLGNNYTKPEMDPYYF